MVWGGGGIEDRLVVLHWKNHGASERFCQSLAQIYMLADLAPSKDGRPGFSIGFLLVSLNKQWRTQGLKCVFFLEKNGWMLERKAYTNMENVWRWRSTP